MPELQFAVADRTGVPTEEQRLIFGGKQMTSSDSFESVGLAEGVTIGLALRLRGGAPKKRCGCMLDATQRCSQAAVRIVGDCSACSSAFCGRHRLPEDHACPGLEGVKKMAHDRLASKLTAERTTNWTVESF